MEKSLADIHIPVIVGSTGVGKTEISLEVAKAINGEIISADSRQIFKGMDIGSAKPTLKQRRRIPHHFVDELPPTMRFSAGEFGSLARRVIDDIIANGRIPIVVGGSGLYVRALMDGFFDGKNWDSDLRNELSNRADAEGLEALYREVIKRDPDAAETVTPNDRKRIIRALEIMELTGQPMTKIWREKKTQVPFRGVWCGITMPRPELYKRINHRVMQMFEKGLISEVEALLAEGVDLSVNAMNSVGYAEVVQYLNGDLHFDEMVELIQQNTRRYAKRQMTWFKSDPRIRWFEREGHETASSVAKRLLEHIRTTIAQFATN